MDGQAPRNLTMVYVDALFETEKSRKWPYTQACHLTADTVDELKEFARKIGLRPQWFQDHPKHPHFDLTRGMRIRAIQQGAKEVTTAQAMRRLFDSRLRKEDEFQQDTTESNK